MCLQKRQGQGRRRRRRLRSVRWSSSSGDSSSEDSEDSEDVWLAALWDDDACVRDRWEEAWVAERLRDIQNVRCIRDRGDASQQTPSLPLRTPHPPL